MWARLRTQEEYEAETPVARLSPFRHIDGWGLGSDFEDLLHNVYLGHAKDALASAVYEVLCERPRHAWEPLMAEWDNEYRRYLRERGFQGAKILLKLKTFGIKPVGAPDFPEVSRRVKAAACKRLIPFIAAKVHRACDGSEHSRQRTMCLWGLAQFGAVLDNSPRHMSVDDLRAAMRAVEAYVACLQSLSNASAIRDQRLWKIRPKVHCFLHLVHRMSLTGRNPRHEATWNNEDFVGRILVSIVLSSDARCDVGQDRGSTGGGALVRVKCDASVGEGVLV